MEIKEEPCRIKDEDTEEQIDPMEVNEDKQQQFQKPHNFTNEDGNAVVSQTEENFTQKRAGKSGVKGFLSCSECGMFYVHKSDLNKHMKSHTGENLFTCTQCGKSFTRKSTLNRHTREHTGERPYTCSQCGKSFVHKGHLKIHMRVHTGEKPYRGKTQRQR
ncbi:gastrula zinc finger protein XlCGF49.1-like [Rhinichthys klamathensis goyatoka]|uniref:gastrula zinc finger protein XlCGF49.1-like n=1 Tax=Rhinichthys klamathensis goyatoka TaxID=3034132 RepID=UPI0024B4F903|nr:gastrula zinc finger protein XlCGF49.1-like [Rhinichthys klamathensis goyatoka]